LRLSGNQGRWHMIRPIQYLRALASLMVVWHHCLTQVPATVEFIRLREFGMSGVDLFFVISGFIMVVTTAEKPLTPWQFFELRIVRVVPLYWLVTLLMIGLAIVAPGAFKTLLFSPAAVAKSLFFVPYRSLSFPNEVWPVLVPGWTLNYEMFFYAIFALTLALPVGVRMIWLVVVLSALVTAGRLLHPTSPVAFVYSSPLLLEFGQGAIIGYLWIRKSLDVGMATSLAAVTVGLWMLFNRGDLWGYSQMAGAALTVIGCLHVRIRAWDSRILLELGNASYSIYLTHLFALGAMRVLWLRLVPLASLSAAVAFMITALAICTAVGWVCYQWVEKPLTKRLRRLVKRKSVGSVSGGAE
jgi:exopolysaccharide production protein ExoZ